MLENTTNTEILRRKSIGNVFRTLVAIVALSFTGCENDMPNSELREPEYGDIFTETEDDFAPTNPASAVVKTTNGYERIQLYRF